jgi:hypothetical protein
MGILIENKNELLLKQNPAFAKMAKSHLVHYPVKKIVP